MTAGLTNSLNRMEQEINKVNVGVTDANWKERLRLKLPFIEDVMWHLERAPKADATIAAERLNAIIHSGEFRSQTVGSSPRSWN
jgi:hypothetical protein